MRASPTAAARSANAARIASASIRKLPTKARPSARCAIRGMRPGGAPLQIAGMRKPPTPRMRPVITPWSTSPRPMSCSHMRSLAAPNPARTAPATPIARAPMTHTKLGGTSPSRKRRSANPITTASSASQKTCARAHCSNHAHSVVPMGATRPTAICHGAGGAVPVRRGIIVKRKPTAKLAKKPWICAIEWKMERYSSVTPRANRSQCSTPAQASAAPSGKKTR